MTETRELRTVMAAAEQAANAGDYAAAEPLLREAALLQEASLGPLHPDLANTLNNLAVVCELTGKMADAEQFYRRAYAVASTALAPDDELRATSERNLRDFCEARGLPLQLPKQPPVPSMEPAPVAASAPVSLERSAAVTSPPPASRTPAAPKPPTAAPPPPNPKPPAIPTAPAVSQSPVVSPPVVSPVRAVEQGSRNPARPIPVGLMALASLILVTILAAYFWVRSDAPESSPTASATPAAPATAPTQPPPAAVTPAPAPPAAPTASSSPVVAEPKRPAPRAAPTLAAPAVVEAQLCRTLSRGGTWRCAPADSPVSQGRLFFYTRLTAAGGTTVHHRWYRGDRLIQAVELKIQPNAQGYRTYSQNTVNAQSGDWRVELAAANGAILHEVRFVVK